MGFDEDIGRVKEQERRLVFDRFNEDIAFEIGNRLRELVRGRGEAIVIDIRLWDRPLFYCAMPGTSADHSDWARRKSNCVKRYGKASYAVALQQKRDGRGFAADANADPAEVAAHGGAFPIRVGGLIVGSITVSGVPMRRDHAYVVEALCAHLGQDLATLELPPE